MKRSIFVLGTPVVLLFACLFAMTSSAENTSKVFDSNVTFTKDVAPIFYKNCTTCHRPGELAPMSLLTFADARPWARSIHDHVTRGTMPPWHAVAAYGRFANERRRTEGEKDTIARWVAAGAPEGDA